MTRPLYDMFNAIPRHYDLLNRIITWGLDAKWRKKAAEACLENSPERVLDICCGTGDLAQTISLLKKNRSRIVALDYSKPMLDVAVIKSEALTDRPAYIIGEASKLPFPDACFDCVGISFAFRNLTYRNPKTADHLAEIFRIIRPGGRFVIVESSQPESSLIRRLFHLYLRLYVKKVGTLISGNKSAYTYLAESAARFHTPAEIREMLLNAGFDRVAYRPFLFGAAGLHAAVKKLNGKLEEH
jgi:demethylmenaquinone methyltransferase/2-methoxy-6-polyprenyl-1,4-benzoquinol methylase